MLAFGVWCMASVYSLAWRWLAFVRLWFCCGWLVVAFARLWREVSVCSLAWWWLAFVRLWFWRGWLAVAFARLWCPRVCSLGRWLASVCFGLVAAGRSRSCVAWTCSLRFGELSRAYTLLVLLTCVGQYASLEEFTGVCRRSTVS